MKCEISLTASGNLALHIPSPAGEQEVEIPFDLNGLRLIRKILSARERDPDQRLGHWSEPTQHMVREWLRRETEEKARQFENKYNIVLEI